MALAFMKEYYSLSLLGDFNLWFSSLDWDN